VGHARRWEVISTPEAKRWYAALEPEAKARVTASINRLRQVGPMLGRPTADRVHASRHHNMKELRSTGGHLRVLFAFDDRQRAVLLVGGDKTNNWKGWYRENIPKADKLFDQHRRDNGGEGRWRNGGRTPDGPTR
jgi:hypothetical protein